jgi:hypothetical protein
MTQIICVNHLSSWSEMQFSVKSVSVRTGIILIHKRMSDTTLNLFYGSNIRMFSYYRCFIVMMEGLYITQYPSTGRAQYLEGNFPLHKVNRGRIFTVYTLPSPPIFFFFILVLSVMIKGDNVTSTNISEHFLGFLLWTLKDFVLWVLWLLKSPE